MRTLHRITIASCLSACVLSGSFALQRLETPRPLDRPPGYQTGLPNQTVLPLGIGSPAKFAVGNSWITSDLMPDDYTTYWYWYDTEVLAVCGGFYTATSQTVTTVLQVKNMAGATVYTHSYSGTPGADAINYIVMTVGMLPAGAYRVAMKFKQGSKVVGQTYWIAVFEQYPQR